jgi:transcription-repair coupling factor (superfamily II helicase)
VTRFEAAPSRHAQQRPRFACQGAIAGSKGYLLARLYAEQRVSLLIVAPDARQRDQLVDDLRCFLSGLPASTPTEPGFANQVLPYDHQVTASAASMTYQQHRALYTYQPLWRLLSDDAVIVVTAVESLRYGVVPPELLRQRQLPVHTGDLLRLPDLMIAVVGRGYRRVPLVESVGEFSVRGGILDIFVPGQSYPWRIEFFGDEVETIRTFEVQSQTSLVALPRVVITPVHPLGREAQASSGMGNLRQHLLAHDWNQTLVAHSLERWGMQLPADWPWGIDAFCYETLSSPLAYLPDAGLLCCVDTEDIQVVLQQLNPPDMLCVGDARAPLPDTHLVAPDDLAAQLHERTDVSLIQYETSIDSQETAVLRPRGAPQFFGVLERCMTQLRQWQADGLCTLILCRFPLEAQRVQAMLATYELGSRVIKTCSECLSDDVLQPGAILLGVGELSQGFVLPELRFAVLRETDIFGDKPRETARPSPSRRTQLDFGTLRAGDRIVHIDYGIGRYRRMAFLDLDEDGGEFMELAYADGATLYVPAYRLSVVQKYSGGGDEDSERLDRLGGTAWARTKERVRESLLAMAESLVQLHAVRQTDEGYAFSAHTALHQEFDSRFEYAETEDQLRAIQEVLADMERPRPMERLVCGDVGYGKTEVAIRAAFKAVYDGKQVAVLVPTTVLAQQHYDTFMSRFEPFPIEIEVMSRMRSRKEQQQVLAGLKQGTVDIVIGTHRLLQKDVEFKELGFLVVDEEHRFGVSHKEKIKRLSTQVDVLMLSATPIPRSLHMTLVGLRDFSTIETPPEGRSAIQTIVTPFSQDTIQQAIRQELRRGGQVFFVHNRIDTLPALKALLAELVPECRISIAHGQMPERALEKIMLQFLRRECDLLLCTTIIESGLDIPSANTIIINHAEQFGLAQLYQLRGRVGRSTQQAYAYLLIPGDLLLSDTARKRIEAIEEFSELSSGFQLAARDLEIRGAGNLLGAQQSGHIASVGFDLYCQMLAEAISTSRGEAVPVRVDPELRLDMQGHIPTEYVDSEGQRLELYRRLAAVESDVALETLGQELRDRFGAMPEPMVRLLAVVECKLLARQLAIERIEQQRGAVLLTFHPQTPVDSTSLLQWLETVAPDFRFQSERVIRLPLSGATPEARLDRLKKHLQQLRASVSM